MLMHYGKYCMQVWSQGKYTVNFTSWYISLSTTLLYNISHSVLTAVLQPIQNCDALLGMMMHLHENIQYNTL